MDTYEIWNSFKTHIYPSFCYQKATQLVFETKTFCNMVEFSFLLLEVVYFYNEKHYAIIARFYNMWLKKNGNQKALPTYSPVL